jgi:hypothetical protein
VVPESVAVPEAKESSGGDTDPYDVVLVASRCRVLLLEVIRRAAHDWVLYRNTRKRKNLLLAEDAYIWLFEEKPGHPHWELRQQEGRMLMAFETICDALDLDAGAVRAWVKKLTVRDIMTAGRPAETRKMEHVGVEDYEAPSGLDAAVMHDALYSSYTEERYQPSY